MIDDATRSSLHRLGTATLHEASKGSGVLPAGIHSITSGLFLAGTALPVAGPAGDNLWIHRAVEAASPGDVLVIDVDGHHESGYWGEVLSSAAKAKQIAGIVIDGCVRDSARLTEVGVPVFARGICIRGTTKRPDGVGHVGQPVQFGDVTVRAGDVVIGDSDGVLVLGPDAVAEAILSGFEREAHEAEILAAIGKGTSTMVLYDLPRELAGLDANS